MIPYKTAVAQPPLMLKPAQVAAELAISVRTLHRWESAGMFPKADLRMNTGVVRWRRETLMVWLEERSRDGRPRLHGPKPTRS